MFFGDRLFGASYGVVLAWGQSWAVAMLVSDMLFDKPDLDRRAFIAELFAERTVHIAAVAPMYELSAATKDFESWDGVIVLLNHVIELGSAVFEASRWVLVDDGAQPTVKLGSWNALFALLVDLQC